MVKVGDRVVAFDPATPFCPFGLVHWSRTNSAALRFSEEPPGLLLAPALPARHGPDAARDRPDARPPGQPRRHGQDDLHGPGGPGPAARPHPRRRRGPPGGPREGARRPPADGRDGQADQGREHRQQRSQSLVVSLRRLHPGPRDRRRRQDAPAALSRWPARASTRSAMWRASIPSISPTRSASSTTSSITLPEGLVRRGPAGAAQERQRFLLLLHRLRRGGPEQAPYPARPRHQEELISPSTSTPPSRRSTTRSARSTRNRSCSRRSRNSRRLTWPRLSGHHSPGYGTRTGGIVMTRSLFPRTLAVLAVGAVLVPRRPALRRHGHLPGPDADRQGPGRAAPDQGPDRGHGLDDPRGGPSRFQRTMNEAGVDAFMAAFSQTDKGVVRFMYARGFNLPIHAAFTVPDGEGQEDPALLQPPAMGPRLPEVDGPQPVHGHRAQAQREEQGRRTLLRGRPDPAGARRRARSSSKATTASPEALPPGPGSRQESRKSRRSSVEVAAPPVVDDEGGQVLDHDPADRFHPQVGEIDRLARDDVLLGDERRRPADRPQEDPAARPSAPRPPAAVRLPLPSDTSEAPAFRRSAR